MLKNINNRSLLEKCSFFYLGFPVALFLLNWVHLYYSLPILAYVGWFIFKNWHDEDKEQVAETKNSYLVILGLLLIFIWVWFSGIGGLSFQNGDYQKHHAVLNDLILIDWPVRYDLGEGREVSLIYYIAYYLPAALVGKLSSFAVAQKFIFIWSLLGIYLGIFWVFRLVGKKNLSSILVFIFFSGLDILGYAWKSGGVPKGGEHIEWWSSIWQFSAMSSQLYWVPQHAIVNWILTPIFFYHILNKRTKLLPIYLIMSLYWSPFISIGLLCYFFYSIYEEGLKAHFKLHPILTSVLLFLPILFYYSSRIPDPYTFWLIKTDNFKKIFPLLFIFLTIEIGVYFILIWPFINKFGERYQKLFKLTAMTLPCYTFYRMGVYNDFCMRGSLPGLYFLMIFVILFINHQEEIKQVFAKQFLIFLLILGGIGSSQEVIRSIMKNKSARFGVRNVMSMRSGIARQYLGKSHGFYFEYLMPKSESYFDNIDKKLEMILEGNDAFK